MPTIPTTINPWTAAQEFASGEKATSAQYNQVVNNLSLLYAKPWAQTTATVSTSVADAGALFIPGQSPSTISNSPASAAGTITFGLVNTSFYGFTVPLTGMYRITMNASIAGVATATTYGMVATGFGGASANNWVYGLRTTTTSTSVVTSSVQSFIVPMSASGTTGAYPTQVYFFLRTTATQSINVTTPPTYGGGTFAQIEYLGTSLGSI